MEHYVTLFDSLFLPQALALHASMQRHCTPFTLWALCMDEAAHEVLLRLALPDVRLLRLADLETPELLAVKPTRTRVEYCWTMTPFTPRFVFEADPTVQRVTYIDADLWFLRNPRALFEELDRARRSVLITEHAYAPQYDRSATSGRFCVQFMVFVRGASESVRSWWEARCLEWCHAREEEGRFGDQKYLDEWPGRFPDDVHILQDLGQALAPWNARRFPVTGAAFYHFHSLRLLRGNQVLLAQGYVLPPVLGESVYRPYLADMRTAIDALRLVEWRAPSQNGEAGWLLALRNIARAVRDGVSRPLGQGKLWRY